MAEQFYSVEQTADLIWHDLTSEDEDKRSSAIKVLAIAPESVKKIIATRSGEAAAQPSDSAEGQQEPDDDVDWRALDHVTI